MTLRHALYPAFLLALTACVNQPDVGGTTQVGKVQALFVEQYPGVFVDRRVAADAATGKPVWAYVKFARPLSDGRKFATALTLDETAVEPGDLVEMRFPVTTPGGPEVARGRNQVIALVAKYNTQAAQRFDQPDRPVFQRLTAAGS